MSNESAPIYLEGHISIGSAIAGGFREISKIYVSKDRIDPDMVKLTEQAERAGIHVDKVAPEHLVMLTGNTKCTDAAAIVGERQHLSPTQLVDTNPSGWFVALDGVEDPYNFGGALRALYAAGAAGVFVGARNWFSAATVVARSSAGASELIPSAIVDDAADLVHLAKTCNLELIVAAEGTGSVSLFESDLTRPMVVIVGGERRGVSKKLLASATKIVRIPYGRANFPSLGTVSASTAIGFEILRQRQSQAPSTASRPGQQPASRFPRTRLPRKPLRGF